MGELVGDDIGDQLLLVLRAGGRVDEHHVLAERDAAEVLHGARREVGQCDEVDLVARVGDAVVLLEPAQAEGPDVEREAREVTLSGDVHDADRCSVDVDRLGHFEAPDDEGDQVAAHHHRVGEPDHGATVGRGPFDLRSVRDRRQVVVDVESDVEDRLELRLVPARERSATVGGLHLRRGDDLLVAVVVDVGAPIETAELVVEDAVERDAQPARTGGDGVRGVDDHPLRLPVEFPCRRDPVDGTRSDPEFGGVQYEYVGVAIDDQADVDLTGERRRLERGSQSEVVTSGANPRRQAVRVERIGRNHRRDRTGSLNDRA